MLEWIKFLKIITKNKKKKNYENHLKIFYDYSIVLVSLITIIHRTNQIISKG